jgi:hypothetical protein
MVSFPTPPINTPGDALEKLPFLNQQRQSGVHQFTFRKEAFFIDTAPVHIAKQQDECSS